MKVFALVLILSVIASFCSSAQAKRWKDTQNWYIAGNAGGATHHSGNDSKSDFAYGAELALSPTNKLDLGFSFTHLRLKYPNSVHYDDYFYMFFGNYHLDASRNGFYVGPQFGIISRSFNAGNYNLGIDTLGLGTRVGYEYLLNEDLSVNLDLRFLWSDSGKKALRINNVDYLFEVDTATFFQYFLTFKYYF